MEVKKSICKLCILWQKNINEGEVAIIHKCFTGFRYIIDGRKSINI